MWVYTPKMLFWLSSTKWWLMQPWGETAFLPIVRCLTRRPNPDAVPPAPDVATNAPRRRHGPGAEEKYRTDSLSPFALFRANGERVRVRGGAGVELILEQTSTDHKLPSWIPFRGS